MVNRVLIPDQMDSRNLQMLALNDARLAPFASSARPAWLWSADGTEILWANPVGVALFGAPHLAALLRVPPGPADARRRQVAQLATRLSRDAPPRLERLRGFGAALSGLLACACSRFDLPDGTDTVLLVAAEAVGRSMPLAERLQRLVADAGGPIAAFGREGLFVGASASARPLLAFRNLSEAGLDAARTTALSDGRATTPLGGGAGHVVLQRIGSGADMALLALLAPESGAPVQANGDEREKPQDDAAIGPALLDPGLFVNHLTESDGETDAPVAIEAPASHDAVAADVPEPIPAELQDEPQPEPAPLRQDNAAPLPPAVAALPQAWRHPLRFVWHSDTSSNVTAAHADFTALLGPHAAARLGGAWADIAPGDARVAAALASHATFGNLAVAWPVDPPGAPLPVELSGLPIVDAERQFAGYRGFGVIRDLDALDTLAAQRRAPPDTPPDAPEPPAGTLAPTPMPETPPTEPAAPSPPLSPEPTEDPVEPPLNVVPIRPTLDAGMLALTPVENSAFNELARRLSERLDPDEVEPTAPAAAVAAPTGIDPDAEAEAGTSKETWLPQAAGQGLALRDRPLLDLMPVGVLIYRLDRLLYANAAFLARTGHDSLSALEDAGGIDALYVEAGVSTASSKSETGTPVTIAASPTQPPAPARLYTIDWNGDAASALIFALPEAAPSPASAPAGIAPAAGHAEAEDLAAILDTTAEGIVMFDVAGRINAANRSAEALFGHDGPALTGKSLADLFAEGSAADAQAYFAAVQAGDASALRHGRDLVGRVGGGGTLPLAVTMGQTRADGPNFFAIFRDVSALRRNETELHSVRKSAERLRSAKADVLARISHDVRTPLNGIIGFADVMIEQRFGALGNERYVDYLKDIRAGGERVLAVIDDMRDLAQIESGTMPLDFAAQDINDVVEQCVGALQAQAARERIIIRTSLAHGVPAVVADARSLRTIVLNLIGNSIHLAKAGGQVIVSTALSDAGAAILRVRDTGHGLNDHEIAAVLARHAPDAAEDDGGDAAVNLTLTRALIEANHARIAVRAVGNAGTLIELLFAEKQAVA